MERIADWLAKLDLGQYAQRFAEHEIDVSVLRHLTDEDLREIGVPLGHRRKILAAINRPVDSIEPLAAAPRIDAKAQEAPERRYVTVLFSDLVGSTALSTRLDPEDLREVIAVYQKCATETVRRFDGYVAKFLGDGILVYFGYPEAHEDDPERAVRAGLELIAAIGGLQTHSPLAARIGIATGLVVVGDLIGSGAAQEQAIVGKTPNLAARLQAIAEPNTVVIAEGTRKLIGNLFELEDLGAPDLKGIAGTEKAWRVVRPSSVESRFDALHSSGLTELVGRQEELDLLLRRWSKVIAGEGQVVLLSGEAGIGKSRLTAALMERLAAEPYTRLRYFCSPQHTDSALYPIISHIERAAGFTHDNSAQAKLDRLDAVLAQSFTPPQDRALFADLLSLPNDGRYPKIDDLTPQLRRQRTFEALTTQSMALAQQSPLLMIFEDVHWIDPTTLEALGRGIDRMKPFCVLLIITYRPEFEPPWVGRPYVTTLTLNRLGERDIAALIDGLAGNNPLPASVRQDIIERTDGIPLFVEEMTKAVLEADGEGQARLTAAAVPSPARAVPASLHASLMARLDRLGPAREVAQIGAAIGREFSYALLAAVAGQPEAEVLWALDRIIAAGLLFRQGVPPHATYLFKHALVQDAAYGTLLRERRRALHARIADIVESRFADLAENQPELLARHCTEAGLIEKAALLWGKAGQRSLERSAMVEAVVQFTTARDLVASLPPTPQTRRQQIKLQAALLGPLVGTKGFAAAETKAAIERAQALIEEAEALGEPLDDPLLLLSVLYGFWTANLFGFNGKNLIEISRRIMALAERQGTTFALMMGHRTLGVALMATGVLSEGRSHLDQAVAFYNPGEHRQLATRFLHAQVANLSQRGMVLWGLGFPDATLADLEQMLKEGREIGHAASLMGALFYASLLDVWCTGHSAERKLVEELLVLAEEKHAPFFAALGTMQRGVVLAVTGDVEAAVPMIDAGISQYRSTNSTWLTPWYLTRLAEAEAKLGHCDKAWQRIFEAFEEMEKGGEVQHQAEINRVAGEIALLPPEIDLAKAERYFEKALTVARAQQAKSWELRAAMSLARLWRDQGKPQQARELLAPVFAWFTEGFDTLDLKEARALLDALAS